MSTPTKDRSRLNQFIVSILRNEEHIYLAELY
jgi:hypothetical protein